MGGDVGNARGLERVQGRLRDGRRQGHRPCPGKLHDPGERQDAFGDDVELAGRVRVEREVTVFPMVPVNKSIGEMMTEAPQPLTV